MSFSPRVAGPRADEPLGQELQALFHRLNNQLGIVLAAELLEAKASDAANRERAAQSSPAHWPPELVRRSVKEQSPRASSWSSSAHTRRPHSDLTDPRTASQNRN